MASSFVLTVGNAKPRPINWRNETKEIENCVLLLGLSASMTRHGLRMSTPTSKIYGLLHVKDQEGFISVKSLCYKNKLC